MPVRRAGGCRPRTRSCRCRGACRRRIPCDGCCPRRRRSRRCSCRCARSRPGLRSSGAACGRRLRRPAPPSGAARIPPHASAGPCRAAPWRIPGRAGRRRLPRRSSSARRIPASLPGLRWCGRRSSPCGPCPAPAARRGRSRWPGSACHRRGSHRSTPSPCARRGRSPPHARSGAAACCCAARRSRPAPARGLPRTCPRRIRRGGRGRTRGAAPRTAPSLRGPARRRLPGIPGTCGRPCRARR
ncbi:hypothetical protein D3C72_1003440 [compost metagenome]